MLRRFLDTEPVALIGLLEALVALVLAFTDVVTPEQFAAILAAIVASHAVIRQLVVSPATDARRSEEAVAAYLGEGE